MHQSCHEARLELIELLTGIAQACEPEHYLPANVQLRSLGQSEEIYPCGRDVLAELARLDGEALLLEFREELTVNEVHLAQVGLSWVPCYARPMFHGNSAVRIAFNAEAGDHRNRRQFRFGERMSRT